MYVDIVISRSMDESSVRIFDFKFKLVHDLGHYPRLDETRAIADARAWCQDNGHVVDRIRYPEVSKMSVLMAKIRPKRRKTFKGAGAGTRTQTRKT